jgi:hypothetical protein
MNDRRSSLAVTSLALAALLSALLLLLLPLRGE